MLVKTIKPADAGLLPSSKLRHYFIRPDTSVVAYADFGRINEADSTTLPKANDQQATQEH
nr:hypothetical protein [Nitrosomonas communis]